MFIANWPYSLWSFIFVLHVSYFPYPFTHCHHFSFPSFSTTPLLPSPCPQTPLLYRLFPPPYLLCSVSPSHTQTHSSYLYTSKSLIGLKNHLVCPFLWELWCPAWCLGLEIGVRWWNSGDVSEEKGISCRVGPILGRFFVWLEGCVWKKSVRGFWIVGLE